MCHQASKFPSVDVCRSVSVGYAVYLTDHNQSYLNYNIEKQSALLNRGVYYRAKLFQLHTCVDSDTGCEMIPCCGTQVYQCESAGFASKYTSTGKTGKIEKSLSKMTWSIPYIF